MSTDLRLRLTEALDQLAAKERHVAELQEYIKKQQQILGDLTKLVNEAHARIDHDEETYVLSLENVVKAVESRSWILEGRGNYEWDDDEYRKEAGYAFEEVREIANRGIRNPMQLSFDFWKALGKKLEEAQASQHRVPVEPTEFEEHWELHCRTTS